MGWPDGFQPTTTAIQCHNWDSRLFWANYLCWADFVVLKEHLVMMGMTIKCHFSVKLQRRRKSRIWRGSQMDQVNKWKGKRTDNNDCNSNTRKMMVARRRWTFLECFTCRTVIIFADSNATGGTQAKGMKEIFPQAILHHCIVVEENIFALHNHYLINNNGIA